MGFCDAILAPVDFSERSAPFLNYVAALACEIGAELTLLHVVPPSGGRDVPYEWVSEAEGRLRDFAHHNPCTAHARRVLAKGDPATEILRMSAELHSGLIALPASNRQPAHGLHWGSVASRVLRWAHRPTLTIAGAAVPQGVSLSRRILCAVDLGHKSQRLLEWASEAAECLGAELHLAHVVPPPDPLPGMHSCDWDSFGLTQTRRMLGQLAQQVEREVTCHSLAGNPATELASLAQSLAADCMIIGQSDLPPYQAAWPVHGGAILESAPCPVVTA